MRRVLSELIKKRIVFGPVTAKRARKHSFILMYHRVLPEGDCTNAQANHALNVSTLHFDSHLSYLKQWFEIVPLSDLVKLNLDKNFSGSRPKLAITFDDGWYDNYHHAWPILKKHNLPATIFLVSDYIGTSKKLWWSAMEKHYAALGNPEMRNWIDDLKTAASKLGFMSIYSALEDLRDTHNLTPDDVIHQLKAIEYGALEEFAQSLCTDEQAFEGPEIIDWDQAREMQSSCIEFGAHTQRHELLTLLSDSQIRDTVLGSARSLQTEGLNLIEIFSYPNGDTNDRVKRTVSDTGFKCAVGTKRGTISPNNMNLMELPRINIGGGNNGDVDFLRQRLARAFWLQR